MYFIKDFYSVKELMDNGCPKCTQKKLKHLTDLGDSYIHVEVYCPICEARFVKDIYELAKAE